MEGEAEVRTYERRMSIEKRVVGHQITIAAVSPLNPRRRAPSITSLAPDGAACVEILKEAEVSFEPRLRCGVYSMQGRRKAMEDAHTIELSSNSYTPQITADSPRLQIDTQVEDATTDCMSSPHSSLCAFFGVYDGHGGKRASNFAATTLHQRILANQHFQIDPKQAIREGFQCTEQEFLDIARKDSMGDGTTALIAFIKQSKLYIGNIGDSEAVLARNGKAIALTTIHNPQKNPTEIERVKREGGKLYHDTRVAHPNLNPSFFNLGVSRSIGDLLFKHPDFTKGKPSGLSADPDVVDILLEKTDQFLILACDGLWDVMDHQQAVDFVIEALKQDQDPQVASKALVMEAYKKGSQDNITAVVCTLQESTDEVEEVRVFGEELKESI
jgi:protein phosphatase 2C family protein 2/3